MKCSLRFTLGPALLFVGLLIPATAEKHITLAQLDQTVASLRAAPDNDGFQRLSDLLLTERLGSEHLAALTQSLPGEKSRQALRAIADQSQFLLPPASELPANPAPGIPEQRRIMGMVATYVAKAIPQLPNFFATRSTDHFEDTPLLQHSGDFFTPHEPLHFITHSEATVFYQKGREVVDRRTSSGKAQPASVGLTTWGVFGPILGTVLVDAASSKLGWSHWESTATGPVAVFEFHVPQEKSHYEINYCCVASEAATYAANVRPFQRIVPYHGSMTVDPSTGIIQRLIVEAELKSSDPVAKAAILVDFGPVDIGGKTYTCPVRSVSTVTAEAVQTDPKYKFAIANALQPLKTSLNDVAFTNYHMFRSDMRVLTPEEADLVQQSQANAPAAASMAENPALPPVPESSPSPAGTPSAPVAEAAPEHALAAPAALNVAPAASAAKPEPEAAPEIATSAATSLPDIPSNSASAAIDTGYRLRTTTRLVEVTVVAFDKKGNPVTDLKQSDFEIYDNGRKQNVNSLVQASSEAEPQAVTSPDAGA